MKGIYLTKKTVMTIIDDVLTQLSEMKHFDYDNSQRDEENIIKYTANNVNYSDERKVATILMMISEEIYNLFCEEELIEILTEEYMCDNLVEELIIPRL